MMDVRPRRVDLQLPQMSAVGPGARLLSTLALIGIVMLAACTQSEWRAFFNITVGASDMRKPTT